MSDFDVQGAKKAGYSDQEIADHLAKLRSFDAAGARSAGYSDSDIIGHLSGAAQRPAGERVARVLGQGAQRATDAIAGTLGAPVDAVAWMARQAGVPVTDPIGGSASISKGLDYLAGVPGQLGLTTPGAPVRFDPENRAERIAGQVGDALGTTASTLIPGMGIARAAAPGLTQNIAKAVTAQPGMQVAANIAGNVAGGEVENMTGDPLLGTGAGLAASLAVPSAAHIGRRVVSAAPPVSSADAERRDLLKAAQQEGIPVSFGNITGSKGAQFAESVLSKLPFVGNRQTALHEAGRTAFDKAALNKVPELRGEGIDAATPGVMEDAFQRVSNKFKSLTANSTANLDSQFAAKLQAAEADMSQQLLTQIPKGIWDKLQELKGAAATLNQPGVTGVSIDGATYQNIRSKLSAQSVTAKGNDRHALGQIISALDDVMERSIPRDMAKDWKEARRSYRVLSMIDDAVSARHSGESAVGHISPASLHARTGGDKEMDKLSRAGMTFIGDKAPDSGTAMRQLALNAGGLGAGGIGAAAFDPLTAAIATGSGFGLDVLLNNPITRAALIGRLNNPSDPVLTKGLVATLTGQRALQEGR